MKFVVLFSLPNCTAAIRFNQIPHSSFSITTTYGLDGPRFIYNATANPWIDTTDSHHDATSVTGVNRARIACTGTIRERIACTGTIKARISCTGTIGARIALRVPLGCVLFVQVPLGRVLLVQVPLWRVLLV
jgi:hypothetical protein